MALTEKTTITAEGLANLIEEFKGKPNFVGILTVFLDQQQDIEASAFTLYNDTVLSNAEGVQLDGIGRIIGEPRFGRSDVDYRVALGARILVNNAEGTPEELINVVNTLIGASTQIVLTEWFPAEFEIETVDEIDEDGFQIGRLVMQTKAAGVHGIFRWHSTTTPFAFDTTDQGFDKGEFAGALDTV